MKKRSFALIRDFKWPCGVLISFVILTLVQVASLRFMNPKFTALSVLERIKSLEILPHNGNCSQWHGLTQISPHLRRAVLAAEDQRFTSHHGFDFVEIGCALKGVIKGKGVRGASTISMQVARTVFLWPQRSWLRKVLECYYTVLIEQFWSKARILEIYLNTVDWGPNLTGAESASKRYFGRSCSGLSAEQAALLAAVLPNPHRWSPNNPSTRVLLRQKRILADMNKMPLLN
jgi:monofunctional biosynthetic peptidoglycan transglycosylase